MASAPKAGGPTGTRSSLRPACPASSWPGTCATARSSAAPPRWAKVPSRCSSSTSTCGRSEMETARVLDCLRSVPLFRDLPDDKLVWISDHAEEVRYGAGAVIARQGDPPDGFYVVMEGETEWTRRVGQDDVFVVTLGEGMMFAELIMVLDAPYPTTGRAVTDVGLLKLDTPSFWEMLRICPEVLRDILATSVERAKLHESVKGQHAKLISLGTMAAGLAHELNNPAAAIGRSAADAREAFREASEKAAAPGELSLPSDQKTLIAGL